MKEAISYAFIGLFAGLGFMLAQDLWWMVTGWAGLCHG